jgi:hypothetical protein
MRNILRINFALIKVSRLYAVQVIRRGGNDVAMEFNCLLNYLFTELPSISLLLTFFQ